MSIRTIFTVPAASLVTVLILLGQVAGAAIFDSPWRGFDTGVFGQGFAPKSFAVGDLDGDGDIDVLVGDSFANSFDSSGTGIAVLKNKGDKTFLAPVFYGLGAGQTVGEVALSDIDLDGDLDAVATIRGNYDEMASLRIWRNNGNGTFGPSVVYPTGEGPAGLVIRDFTGDGRPDIVTANYTGLSVSVLTHNGQTGSAAGFGPTRDYPTNLRNEKIAFADVNGDGRQDLAVGGQIPSTTDTKLAIMLNDGAGGFTVSAAYESAPGSRFSSTAVALSDLDLDGDFDLIGGGLYSSGSTDSGAVTIRRNNGSGIFGSPETLLFDVFAEQPKEISIGELNGDGYPDIIAAIPSGRAVEGFETILSNGSGGFRTPVYNEASQQTFDVFPVDLDNDSDLDVIALANSSAAITVHENNGSGQFAVLPRYEVASLSDAVESADIDNDGDLDIVVNGEVDIASNDAVVKILKNNGNGTFAPAASYSPPRNFADMKLRDINGDGFVDIIFAPDGNYPNYHIGTALNLGNGTFAPTVVKQIFSCGEGTIDAADLDGDGDRDIVLTEEEGCQGGAPVRIFILRNDGGQNFTQMADLHPAGLPHGLWLADVNGDGKQDVVTAVGGDITVYPGNGNLTFGAAIASSAAPYSVYRFKLADFDLDGKIDVGMITQQSSFGTDVIATALGNGDGTFRAPRGQTGSSVLENLRISDDIEVADFNLDGRPDIVTVNYASNDISFFAAASDGSLLPHERYGVGNTPHLATAGDFDGDSKPDLAAAIGLPPSGLHNAVVILKNIAVTQPVGTTRMTPFDFDGDGKTDISIFRPSVGQWWIQKSGDNQSIAAAFGSSTDIAVPADYTGDRKTDIAFFRPSTGQWFVLRSEDFSFYGFPFGSSTDGPAPADYDGDGKADPAVFRSGAWYIQRSSDNGVTLSTFGAAGDKPVTADYDGDGKADIGVYRPNGGTSGEWWIMRSTAGLLAASFGSAEDKTAVGDYTGDGKADCAFFRPSTGTWYVLRSEDFSFFGFPFGVGTDLPAPGDYDGDGKLDAAVFRTSGAAWFVNKSSGGVMSLNFGAAGDLPVPGSFVR